MSEVFEKPNPKVNLPELDQKMVEFWKKEKIFEKSVENRSTDKQWTFLDGPPFITGLPHYGHIVGGIAKDVFPRFWTMNGYRVRRVWGWDCHGLPAENKVEKELGVKRKKDIIEKVGVKKFIDECRIYVNQVSSEWSWYVDHMGRWVDFENAYKTMDTSYMESVMWVFSQMYKKGYIYKGKRVSLYCPHCETPISNFEVSMDPDNYKDETEESNTYKYKLVGMDDTYILAWSTTPWTKLVTTALAVNPDLEYLEVEDGGVSYIFAKSSQERLGLMGAKVVREVKGSDLVGLKFERHFDFYDEEEGKLSHEIVPADFVTAEEGTGVVTLAAYGAEDFALMQKLNILSVEHLNDDGTIKDGVSEFSSQYYLKANALINDNLKSRGLVFESHDITHSIPTCWRCHERLYYAPQNAWYVDVDKLKPTMRKTMEATNWVPSHFKEGRFAKSMEAAPHWCISRTRFWGSPVPVWECECGERIVPESIEELQILSGTNVAELHKPEIDEVKVICPSCGKLASRVPEVLDSWIEAGSASFAERHFPFAKEEDLGSFFPPDFIVEYTGQIRAWFYVLHVIGAALYESPSFKDVLVTGVVLGTDGRKMSKNYGNYPDPKKLMQEYGGDALRLYLMGSPVMKGEDMKISEEAYRSEVKGMLLTLWNVYNFFVTFANAHNFDRSNLTKSVDPLDSYIKSRLNQTNSAVTASYKEYNTESVVTQMKKFVDDLSNWYVRRIRDRVSVSNTDKDDVNSCLSTLYTVLVEFAKISAPMTPFVSEQIFKNLTGKLSVHLEDWPEAEEFDLKLIQEMEKGRELVSAILSLRKEKSIGVRWPLIEVNYDGFALDSSVLKIVCEEVNAHKITLGKEVDTLSVNPDDFVETNVDHDLGSARDLIRSIQEQRKLLETSISELVDVVAPNWPSAHTDLIKSKALIRNLTVGEFLVTKVS